MRTRGRRSGVSLVELLVALGAISALAVYALPVHETATDNSRDALAAVNLRIVLQAELQHFDTHGSYTVDRAALLQIAPGLPLGQQGRPGSVYIVVGISRASPAVCLFSEGGTGWHTIYHSRRSGTLIGLGGPADCTHRMLDEQRQTRRRPSAASPAIPTPGRSSPSR